MSCHVSFPSLTCIFRCLRFATTGDYPPGSYNGRHFVHDPKVIGDSKVTGNVKLTFIGVDNKKYICNRSTEATQKPKNITIKTLDSYISKQGPDGSIAALDSKCVNINEQMFMSFGVSKPILNYVIFCHQEDSNWPLEEGSKVKDKFDEIFASKEYNTLLKHIKDTRSKKQEEHKLIRKDVEYYVQDMQLAKSKRKELAKKKATQTSIQEEYDGIESEIKPIEAKLIKIQEIERDYSGVQAKFSTAETSLKHCRFEIRDLREQIEEEIPASTTSDSELEKMKTDMMSEERKFRMELEDCEGEIASLNSKLEREQDDKQEVMKAIQKCKTMQDINKKNKDEVQKQLGDISDHLSWDIPNRGRVFQTDKGVREAVGNLDDTIHHKTMEKQTFSDKKDSEIEEQQKAISSLEISKAQIEEKKALKTNAMISKKRETALIKRQLSDLDGFGAKLTKITRTVDGLDDKIKQLKGRVDIDKVKADFDQKSAKCSTMEKELKDVKKELASMESQRDTLSQISMKKDYLEGKKGEIEMLLSKCDDDLITLYGSKATIPTLSTLKSSFADLDEMKVNNQRELDVKMNKLKSRVDREKDQQSRLMEEVRNHEDRIRKFEQKISDLATIDTFDIELDTVKADVEKTRQELQVKEANKFTFQQFIDKLKQSDSGRKKSCPTCCRAFSNQNETNTVIDHLKEEIKKIPSKVKFIENRLKAAIDKQEKLQNLRPEKTQCAHLRDELDGKRSKVEETKESLASLKKEITETEDEIEAVSMEIMCCGNVRESVLRLDSLNKECIALEDELEELNNALGAKKFDRDYNEVKQEEESLSSKVDGLRSALESLRTKKSDYENELINLEKERNGHITEKLQLESKQQGRANLEAKKRELESQIEDEDAECRSLERDLGPKKKEIAEAKAKKATLVEDKTSRLRELGHELDELRRMQADLQLVLSQIADYDSSGNETRLVSLEEDFELAKETCSKTLKQKDEKESKKQQIEKMISGQDKRKRMIDDNLRLRKYVKDENKHRDTVQELQDQMDKLKSSSEIKEKKRLLALIDDLEKARNMKKGRLDEMEITIADLERELNEDRLRLAENRHRNEAIKERVGKHVIDDLNKYYIALDWAIMRFHKERMEVINRLIKDLWRSTYRGNDIDYIAIRTDDVDTVHGADKRKATNYRVVMVKKDTELEMRGRCSAGQKVLASLIIRLALAETFSSGCGIIA